MAARLIGVGALALMACTASSAPDSQVGTRLAPTAETSVQKPPRSAAQEKISSALLAVIELFREGGLDAARQDRRFAGLDIDSRGHVLVDIRAEVTPDVLTALEATGGALVSEFPDYEAIRARLPLDKVEEIAERSEVKFIRPAEQAITNPSRGPV